MSDTPEKAVFSIEKDGEEYDVEVSREVFEQAIGRERPDGDAVATWLQDNLVELSHIAHRKLSAGGAAGGIVTISDTDWRARPQA